MVTPVGTSKRLRIAAAAEQRNTSAVAYHFGTKRALIDAIYAHRLAPASEEQLRLLAGLDEQERGHDLRSSWRSSSTR